MIRFFSTLFPSSSPTLPPIHTGALWKATTDRSKWEALAAEDTARYKREMEAYKAKQAADAAGGGEGGDVKEEGGE